ncbi:patj homolog isoform X1 [Frankliniella occidentalis]|uniref:Patj homolog isoform X1 n=3 Tax=Frankliniella occidentalis TaxID=133901 RepID=A0A9C6TW85_FRAOC|nr:patj homolog isoform X1 [Frankliniella occidentalis]
MHIKPREVHNALVCWKKTPTCTMPLNSDISTALQLLEHIQHTINSSDDVKLQSQTTDDLNLLISVLENPIFRSIVTIQDSLTDLNQQLQDHPSILPVDFDIAPTGELVLNVPREPDLYYLHHGSQELDDQRVPQLSHSSSGDTNSPPQMHLVHSPDGTQPPITTSTYALEFQKAIEQSSHGRQILFIQLFKPENTSLGFSVVGLRSEDRGELGIFVQDIQIGGIAGRVAVHDPA